MPELPEVETTVRDLQKKVLGRTFIDVWADSKKTIKRPTNFGEFKKSLIREKIENIRRRGKNILIDLSSGKTLLIHQKLTGHLLLGKWILKKGKWDSLGNRPLLKDPKNQFLHLIFWLDNGLMLALSDVRKFAKVELWNSNDLEISEGFKKLGPEPLEKSFTFALFHKILEGKKGKIKQILMDQGIIAGIGNIYSDEILWDAKVHPFRDTSTLTPQEIRRIYQAIKKILLKAIEFGGESFSDFRRISGGKGGFGKYRKIYQREGEQCSRCGTVVQRIKLGGRSTRFCPKCQGL